MVGFAVSIGAFIAGGFSIIDSSFALFLACLTGFALTGSANTVNDYFDRDIDLINEPGRPIPSGSVTPQEALATFVILSAIGLAAAGISGLINLVIAVLAWITMFFYSTYGKRTGFPGNLMVSFCISLPFVYGGLVTGVRILSSSIIFSIVAFLLNTGREVTKGIADVEGDSESGIKTIAVTRGPMAAAWVSVFFYFLAVTISFLPVVLKMVSFWYVPFILFADFLLIYQSYSILKNSDKTNSKRVKTWVLRAMMVGLLAFLSGSV
jgi:geranylgeranylglycerol-phosphate geranylgeranyltransferase